MFNVNCTSSIANAGYSITLDPGNMMGSAVIGMSLSFSDLNATKGVSSPRRGREGMQLQACAVDHQKLYE